MRSNRTTVIIAFALAAFRLFPCNAEIRLSLLEDATVLDETVQLLEKNGCSSESAEAFRKAVRFHNNDLFDRSRFPNKKNGFYDFRDLKEVTDAIRDPFVLNSRKSDLPHNSLVCLDIVVLLTKGSGACAPLVTNDFAHKCFAKYKNRGTEENPDFTVDPISSYSFYRNGRTLLYPANGYALITGLTRSDSDVALAVSLKAERMLPGDFIDNDEAISKLFSTWNSFRKKDGLVFPDKIKIVTVGYIPMRFRYWAIDHVAIDFIERGKLIYIEKNGPRGPFMRVDFDSEQELARFAANKILAFSEDPKEINFQAPVFVSVNDRLIYIARP